MFLISYINHTNMIIIIYVIILYRKIFIENKNIYIIMVIMNPKIVDHFNM